MSDPDPAKAQRVMQAMLQMNKLDIAALQQASGTLRVAAMKYMCLICAETVMEHMTRRPRRATIRSTPPEPKISSTHGTSSAANRLQPVNTATTVRVRHGR